MVYLLHFDRPYQHVRHSVLVAHTSLGDVGRHLHSGQVQSSPLLTAAAAAGCVFIIARKAPERSPLAQRLESTHNRGRVCPICKRAKP